MTLHHAIYALMTVASLIRERSLGLGRGNRRRTPPVPGTQFRTQLSGGQRQRVAVARALAVEPAVLMDEPLSNLDALLRLEMRAELKSVLREAGTTTIYVTHDQTEAMGLANRIAVLHAGRIQQVGPPAEVYASPATTFVGGFVGSPPMNFLTLPVENGCIRLGALTIVSPAATGGQIVLGIRPEDLAPVDAAEGFPFMLRVAEPLGSHIMLTGETGGQHVRVVVPPETPVHIGVMMYLNPRRDRIVWMDPASGTAVGSKEAGKLGNKAASD